MKAVILAAGRGTRLAPLTDDKPKCLVPLRGRPLIDYQLSVLRTCGIGDIVIVGGYRVESLAGYARTYRNDVFETSNMVHSLFCAEQEFTDDLVIAYGDIIYEPKVLSAVLSSNAGFSVAVDRGWRDLWDFRMEDPLMDAETLKIGSRGEIIEIGKKASSLDEIQGQYLGLIKITKERLPEVSDYYHRLDRNTLYDGKNFSNMYMTSFIQSVCEKLMTVSPVWIQHGWLEVDTLEDLRRYEGPAFDHSPLLRWDVFPAF